MAIGGRHRSIFFYLLLNQFSLKLTLKTVIMAIDVVIDHSRLNCELDLNY